jgi:tetratricopeptide (TPR) repeat protein
MWSVLSYNLQDTPTQINISAVVRAFESLPRHLRTYLGPILVEKFSSNGDMRSAGEVLRRLERMEGMETNDIAVGKALLDIKGGQFEEAGRRLQTLSVEGGPEIVETIVALIDLAEAQDETVPQRIVDLSQAFAVELRNSEPGELVWEAHIRALIANQNYKKVFSELDAAVGIPEQVLLTTWQKAMQSLVEDSSDLEFLKHATNFLAQSKDLENGALILQFARRFLDLGLPSVALEQLESLSDWEANEQAPLVRAQSLLELGRPEEAEIVLIGQRGRSAEELRAEARQQMGDFVFSRTLFEGAGNIEGALYSAWLSGDWNEVAKSENTFSGAAGLMQQNLERLDSADIRLESVEDISVSSEQSRETLRLLLEATEVLSE